MPLPLETTEAQLIKRLKSDKELRSFVRKVKNVLDWCRDNPTNSDNVAYSDVKENVRAHLTGAWDGF